MNSWEVLFYVLFEVIAYDQGAYVVRGNGFHFNGRIYHCGDGRLILRLKHPN
ncbi:MAG TPA: hypothetical protein VK658_14720 [Chryseolinea sp.]|nr:hypothetical protein [Chryseolinea sp.]